MTAFSGGSGPLPDPAMSRQSPEGTPLTTPFSHPDMSAVGQRSRAHARTRAAARRRGLRNLSRAPIEERSAHAHTHARLANATTRGARGNTAAAGARVVHAHPGSSRLQKNAKSHACQRAFLKPSRAPGHSGPQAAAPLKPWVKTCPPDGNELPSAVARHFSVAWGWTASVDGFDRRRRSPMTAALPGPPRPPARLRRPQQRVSRGVHGDLVSQGLRGQKRQMREGGVALAAEELGRLRLSQLTLQ